MAEIDLELIQTSDDDPLNTTIHSENEERKRFVVSHYNHHGYPPRWIQWFKYRSRQLGRGQVMKVDDEEWGIIGTSSMVHQPDESVDGTYRFLGHVIRRDDNHEHTGQENGERCCAI